ncbi:MAG: hypothetical protein EOP86_11075 [Verrucomicrobiaceae bacterium]|nr:MAG: hypothetical protein EOP86_11075 [Verrucomicrobiaceae bacterium]
MLGAARLARITAGRWSAGQLQPPALPGFDEKAIRKEHRDATLLTEVAHDRVIDPVEEHTSEAAIVFNKFHIKKHLNEAVDKVRRRESQPERKRTLVTEAVAGPLREGRRGTP